MSRLQQAKQAIRPALKGRMMLSGPAGSGKTRSGLIIARELAEGGRTLGIDTEQESMLTYADDFDFEHLAWHPPFDPRELTELFAEAGDTYAVIFLDSASHFWRKEGGVLDIANGKFTGWKEARPVQEALVDGILHCKAHVILGVRSKVEHTQEVEGGKHVVKKLGMAAQQDDDLEFEMNVAVEMAMDHTATVSKSRTTMLPVGRSFGVNRTAEMGQIYRDWLKGGEPPAEKEDVEDLVKRMNALDDEPRKECKQEFFNRHGRPEQLRESQVDAATKLVAGYEAKKTSQPEAGKDGDGAASGWEAAAAPQPPAASETDRKRWAKQIHTKATRSKVSDVDLDLILMNVTKLRTEHADQLDAGEVTITLGVIDQVANDDTMMQRIREAVGHAQAAADDEAKAS